MKSIKPSFLTILVLIPFFFAAHECSVISSHDADETEVQKVILSHSVITMEYSSLVMFGKHVLNGDGKTVIARDE